MEGYRRDYGAVENDSEFVHLFVGDSRVDRSIVDLNAESAASQTEQKWRSMRLIPWRRRFINGDAT